MQASKRPKPSFKLIWWTFYKLFGLVAMITFGALAILFDWLNYVAASQADYAEDKVDRIKKEIELDGNNQVIIPR